MELELINSEVHCRSDILIFGILICLLWRHVYMMMYFCSGHCLSLHSQSENWPWDSKSKKDRSDRTTISGNPKTSRQLAVNQESLGQTDGHTCNPWLGVCLIPSFCAFNVKGKRKRVCIKVLSCRLKNLLWVLKDLA